MAVGPAGPLLKHPRNTLNNCPPCIEGRPAKVANVFFVYVSERSSPPRSAFAKVVPRPPTKAAKVTYYTRGNAVAVVDYASTCSPIVTIVTAGLPSVSM